MVNALTQLHRMFTCVLVAMLKIISISLYSVFSMHTALILHGDNEGVCPLVIALVPLKCSSKNSQFAHPITAPTGR